MLVNLPMLKLHSWLFFELEEKDRVKVPIKSRSVFEPIYEWVRITVCDIDSSKLKIFTKGASEYV